MSAPLLESGYLVAIRPLGFFRASECVDQDHVRALAERIRTAGCWTHPLPVEASTGLVMDGNHRLQAAHLLGLVRLPCVPLRYGDPYVEVACWRTGLPFDINAIFAAVQHKRLLPLKSTRHRFDPPLPATQIEVDLLM